MSEEQILEHLQKTFGGQLVLYPSDIAKILNKSDKAVQQLISRGGLPFSVKSVGGRRCVDIFQVAKWLATDLESPKDLELSRTVSPSTQERANKTSVSPRTGKGIIGKKLMDRRYQVATSIFHMAATGALSEETGFLLEIAEAIARSLYQVGGAYTVFCNKNFFTENGIVSEASKRTFVDLAELQIYLSKFRNDCKQVMAGRIVVRKARKCIFHSFSLGDDRWTALINDLSFDEGSWSI